MKRDEQVFALNASGRRGADGLDGHRGHDGSTGRDGGQGQSAGAAARGEPAGVVNLHLSAGGELGFGMLQVVGSAAPVSRAATKLNEVITDGDLKKITLHAIGGDGGRGGVGGDGGDGGRGRNGSDATRYSSGGNGGDGGDGGDGGRGSDGADGGRGGRCTIQLHEDALYLLMAIEGSHEPAAYVRGGRGGAPGRHGQGGAGGSGGSGGSSYSWTETETYRDSNGETQTRHTTHSNPGGWSGSSGSRGWTPNTPLRQGQHGDPGQYLIIVTDAQGQQQTYPNRYALALMDFSIHEDLKEDVDGILEFGEVVHIAHLKLRNIGHMPTPPKQRVRIILAATPWIRPFDDELIIEESLAPFQDIEITKSLRFQIALPQIDSPGEPFVVKDTIRPAALQLGQERPGSPAKLAPFQRIYDTFNFTRELTAQFPVENREGIIGLRSLAIGERTRIMFDVGNVSQVAIGHDTERKRRVGVQLEYIGGDVGTAHIVFINHEGHQIDLAGQTDGFEGYFELMPQIEPHSSARLSGLFGFIGEVAPYAGVTLRASIWLAEHHNPDQWRLVQRREATFRAEPIYRYRPESRVILVTNNNTSREAFLAWQQLLDDQLGLPFDHWSLARYGHFDHQLDLEDGTNLKVHLEDKVAVVLNQPFEPRGTQETDLPTDYIKGRDVREGATTNNTHFLMVGSDQFDGQQLLEPTSDVRRGGDDFDTSTRFLDKEERTGGPLAAEIFKEDLTTSWDEVTLHDWTFFTTPDDAKRLKLLRKQSMALMDKLQQMHPNRRYVLVEHAQDGAKQDGRSWLVFPRWDLGHVEVRRTLNNETSSTLVLHTDTQKLNDPSFILSPQNRYAVFLALPFETKLERLNWLLQGGDALEGHRLESAKALVSAIMTDLSEEQSALAAGNYALSPSVLEQKLSNLGRLVREPLHTELGVDAQAWWMLFELCASLEALIEASRTWKFWSRDNKIAAYTEAQLKPWLSAIFDAHAVTAQGDVALDSKTAKARYSARRDELVEIFSTKRAELKRSAGLKASEAYVAREHFEHPVVAQGKLLRDIDLWTNHKHRIWTAAELEQARQRELARHQKQEQLRQLNAQRRAQLLDEPQPQVTLAHPEVALDLSEVPEQLHEQVTVSQAAEAQSTAP